MPPDRPIVRARLAALALSITLTACDRPGPDVAVDRLPPAAETLRDVRARLGRSYSERRLSALATENRTILGVLKAAERRALGRDWIRFRLDQPAEVLVAAAEDEAPFWLDDQGFAVTPIALDHPDGRFRVYARQFPAGWVGLGVNTLDRTADSHYAVFVRGGAVLSEVRPDGLETSMVVAEEPARPFIDDDSAFAGVPAELVGSTIVRTRRGDRRATALIRDRAWKTRLPSGRRADQVAIAFGADAGRSLTWTWRTEPGRTESRVRLARAAAGRDEPADASAFRAVEGTSELLEIPDLVNDPIIRRHRATADGLEPDTRYVYAIEDGSPAGATPWRGVSSGPVVGSERAFTFLYLGDPQTGLPEWGRLLDVARRRTPEAAFLMIAGDLVDRGNERTNWDHFFLRAAGVFDGLPMMPAVGNHEYLDGGPRVYRATFAPPSNGPAELPPGLAYAFSYGPALFVVLDTEVAIHDPAMAEAQARWLDATLGASPAPWKLAMFHHPLYASHPTREQPALRDLWAPIFEKHGVPLVLQGHDHAYLRTYPLRGDGRPSTTGEPGTTYVVSVSGDKFYAQRPRDDVVRGLTDVSTYQTIRIDPAAGRLTYRAFDVSGAEVDAFDIERPARLAGATGNDVKRE